MIKISYEGKPYDYGDVGHQAYNIKTEIVLEEDCSLADIIEAIVIICENATYVINEETLKGAVEEYLINSAAR